MREKEFKYVREIENERECVFKRENEREKKRERERKALLNNSH